MSPKLRALLTTLAIGLTLDQATKAWARTLGPRDRVVVIEDWLEFVHAKNPGAAFSMLADSPYRMWFFAVFTVVSVVVLVGTWRSGEAEDRVTSTAIGMFLVGALGNAMDRVMFGHVTDFVKVYAGRHGPQAYRDWFEGLIGSDVWPIWNVADAAIFCAVPVFLLPMFFRRDTTTGGESSEGESLVDPLDDAMKDSR